MPTKYILHGGFPPRTSQHDAFFKAMLDNGPSEPRILLVYFAKDAGREQVCSEQDHKNFMHNASEKRLLSFTVATRAGFVAEATNADIIYLRGGKTLQLLHCLQQYGDLKEVFSNKVVAGESAGANVLSALFYSKTEGGVFSG